MTTTDDNSWRPWAYAGMAFGGIGSIAANVAAAFIPPHAIDPDLRVGQLTAAQLQVLAGEKPSPDIVGIIWGVAIAVVFFIVVQVVERTPWPANATRMERAKRLGPAYVVAAGAGAWSYYHLVALLLRSVPERTPITVTLCFVGPLIIDGAMVVCSMALINRVAAIAELATLLPESQLEPTAAPAPIASPVVDDHPPVPATGEVPNDTEATRREVARLGAEIAARAERRPAPTATVAALKVAKPPVATAKVAEQVATGQDSNRPQPADWPPANGDELQWLATQIGRGCLLSDCARVASWSTRTATRRKAALDARSTPLATDGPNETDTDRSQTA